MAISVSLNGEIFEQVFYSREEDFEQLVAKNAVTIFGNQSIYINAKRKITTSTLGGTIPDGFLIDLSDPEDPQFYLVEIELQSHDFFKHIFPQITKFFAFYMTSEQRHKLIETIFAFLKDNFGKDMDLAAKMVHIIKSNEVYKFLKDTIDSSQNILIIIDGPKPEFEEIINTYTDTWRKMVKVQIVNHFRRGENNIITVEPPFQNLEFGDAVSPFPPQEPDRTSPYTEEFHLKNCNQNVKDVYSKLKARFLEIKSMLEFNPIKSYIGVVDRRNIAFIMPRKKKIRMVILLSEDEVKENLHSGHHKVLTHSEPTQRAWAGGNPNCSVEITDTEQWDEIQKLLKQLVEKYQET